MHTYFTDCKSGTEVMNWKSSILQKNHHWKDMIVGTWYLLEILLRTFDKLCINALYALCQWKENYFGKLLINAKHKSDSLLHRNIGHSALKMEKIVQQLVVARSPHFFPFGAAAPFKNFLKQCDLPKLHFLRVLEHYASVEYAFG